MEDKEKSKQKYHFAMAVIWIHKLCLQNQALYALDHGACPPWRLHDRASMEGGVRTENEIQK